MASKWSNLRRMIKVRLVYRVSASDRHNDIIYKVVISKTCSFILSFEAGYYEYNQNKWLINARKFE